MNYKRLAELLTISYPISRPLPHARSLGIAMVFIAISLSTLFGFVAVATNAYTVQSIYTSNPTKVESEQKWFQREPFTFFDSIQTKCQPAALTAGNPYMTTNHGFTYNLDYITRDNGQIPQVMYKDAVLGPCRISHLGIDFSRSVTRNNVGQWWSWGDTTTYTFVKCIVHDDQKRRNTVSFNYKSPPIRMQANISSALNIGRDRGLVDMWYGGRLTASWFKQVVSAMSSSEPHGKKDDFFATGSVSLFRNHSVTDWTSLHMFKVEGNVKTQHGDVFHINSTIADWNKNNVRRHLPDLPAALDAFAKSFYYLLALDFGIEGNNALTTSEGIDYLQTIFDPASAEGYEHCMNRGNVSPGYCLNGTIDALPSGRTAKFNSTRPARLVDQYLCSVPMQKSPVSVIYSVVLAILVFMRAAWSLFTRIARLLLMPSDTSAQECVGCAAFKRSYVMLESRPPGSQLTVNTSYDPGFSEDDELLQPGKLPREVV